MNPRRIRFLIRKEFLQLRRDPTLIRIALMMPIVQLILMGYVVAADVTSLPTAVVDLDRTTVSRRLAADLGSSGYFDITRRPGAESDLRALFDGNVVKVAVVIPEGTTAALTRGEQPSIGVIVDGTDNVSASVGPGYALQAIARFNSDRAAAMGLDLSAAPGLDARIRVQFNPTLSTVNTMIPALIAALMLISMGVIMSQAVVKERESGTLEQLFVTPIRPAEYVVGKVTPYVVLASAQAAVVALLGMVWFRVPFNGSVLVVAAGLALFMLVSVGTGLLVSLVSRTRAQAQQTVLFVMLPSMILSGFIFPVASMPVPFQVVSRFIPLTHILVVLRGAFVKDSGFGDLAMSFAWLAGFAVLIFGAAVAATHRRIAE
ncbi:ABC transporter permease [Propionicicella superfundia]|uniref:ABC transporter permease n=1 Tax=Propionicicella superfundia TaxID=348582 RepID=UPI000403B949|nr:ABC transporter permease [Propionicicella superfundia]